MTPREAAAFIVPAVQAAAGCPVRGEACRDDCRCLDLAMAAARSLLTLDEPRRRRRVERKTEE